DAPGAGRRRRPRHRRGGRLWGTHDVARLPRHRRPRRRRGAGPLRGRAAGPGRPRRDHAAARRLRGLPADPRRVAGADPDADRPRGDARQGPRPRPRRRRLPDQALRPPGTAGPTAGAGPARRRPGRGPGRLLRAGRPRGQLRGAPGHGRGQVGPPDPDRVPPAGGAGPPRRHHAAAPRPARTGLGVGLERRPRLPEGLRPPPPPETRRRRRQPPLHPDRVGRRLPVRRRL
ncbi:MAG: Two-component transcriptional response regulator, LuxR family, partial [uncultured Thermomicrobiales bacterium]